MLNTIRDYAQVAKDALWETANDHENGRKVGLMFALSGAAISYLCSRPPLIPSEFSTIQTVAKTVAVSLFILGAAIWARAVTTPPAFLREHQN